MDLKLLLTLKQMLFEADEFSKIWGYFLDHFGEKPEFIALGDRVRPDLLEQILLQVGQQLFRKKVSLGMPVLTRIPEYHFIHGAFALNGKPANVLYFEDICAGVLSVFWSFSPPETKMVRFTGRPMPPGSVPSRN